MKPYKIPFNTPSPDANEHAASIEAEAWTRFAAGALGNSTLGPKEAANTADKLLAEFRGRFMEDWSGKVPAGLEEAGAVEARLAAEAAIAADTGSAPPETMSFSTNVKAESSATPKKND